MARHPKDPFEQELEDSIKRLVGAVGRGLADTVEHTVERARGRREAELARQEKRRRDRAAAKRRQREEKYGRHPIEGWTLSMLGAVLLIVALFIQPQLWWLLFPGLFFGLRGVRILGHNAEQKKLATPPPLPVLEDPREARLDRVCDGLLAAFREAPEQVRAFFGKPEQTVDGLRKSAKDLLRRERQLRALVNPEEEGRLASERDRLAARVAAESDAVARERFAAALSALDQQISQRRDIARNASRLEAEHTRLLATLEGLHVNVVRLRTADLATTDLAGAGVRTSLESLKAEVTALADAAEEVNRIQDFAEPPQTFDPGIGSRNRKPVR